MTTVPQSRAQRAFYRAVNPVMMFMVRRGAGGSGADLLRILRVRGRKSGRLYELPVRVAVLDGQRYLISMLGDTQWARNLRAAGQAELVYRSAAEAVTAREVTGPDKAGLLTRLCGVPQFADRARSVLKSAFGHASRELGEPEIRLLGQVWHVFQLGDAPGRLPRPRRPPPFPAEPSSAGRMATWADPVSDDRPLARSVMVVSSRQSAARPLAGGRTSRADGKSRPAALADRQDWAPPAGGSKRSR